MTLDPEWRPIRPEDDVPPTPEECAHAVEEAFRRVEAMTPGEVEALAIDGEFAQIAARFRSHDDPDDAAG